MPSTGQLIRRAVVPAAALAALVAGPVHAQRPPIRTGHPQALLARTPSGAQPNAPATEPAISGDGRLNRYAAFTSAATDIVAGSGSHRNVFLVVRARPFNLSATTQWRNGKVILASKGRGGPANGDSWGAGFDGYDYVHAGREITVKPRCMAFISAASNLVGGDGNGHPDVFLRKLATGKLTRIATAGAASEVALDGRCRYLSYVSGGRVYNRTLGTGRTKRISPSGGCSSPEVSANGKITTYSCNGAVYVNRQGDGGTHKVGPGAEPTADEWGRFVAFTRGDAVYLASTQGAARAHVVESGVTAPSMTAGGHFVFYVRGPIATSNVYKSFASCPDSSHALQIAGSPHGNYAAFSCAGGALYMSYVGAR
jgi:hypothetical protein